MLIPFEHQLWLMLHNFMIIMGLCTVLGDPLPLLPRLRGCDDVALIFTAVRMLTKVVQGHHPSLHQSY